MDLLRLFVRGAPRRRVSGEAPDSPLLLGAAGPYWSIGSERLPFC